jgi:hypothetical protein
MTERRESEEISRAAQRMAEAAEEMSRTVDRLAAERGAVPVQAFRFWEEFARAVEAVESIELGGRRRIAPSAASLSEEEAVLFAVQSVREVREALWADRETQAPAPDAEAIEQWEHERQLRREKEGYQLP